MWEARLSGVNLPEPDFRSLSSIRASYEWRVIQAVSANSQDLNSVASDVADVSGIYAVLPAGNSTGHRRLPARSAFFPLIVGELFDVGAVETHHEDLAVGLRRIRISHLVLEAHPGTREGDRLAVERPRHMGVIPFSGRQPLERGPVRLNCEDVVRAIDLPREHN